MVTIIVQCETAEEAGWAAGLVHALPEGMAYEVWQSGTRVLKAENAAPPSG